MQVSCLYKFHACTKVKSIRYLYSVYVYKPLKANHVQGTEMLPGLHKGPILPYNANLPLHCVQFLESWTKDFLSRSYATHSLHVHMYMHTESVNAGVGFEPRLN